MSMRAARWVLFCCLSAFTAAFLWGASAQANPRYAALVMHADTGDVLFARHADEPRYPASLTKVMTLYLLFEAVEAGNASLDGVFTVSKRAAGQAPSKLGVTPGEKLNAETAVYALIVRSANDVATTVAENLAGTEYRFAQLMTKKARELGMRRTTFRNASGLPNRYQKSTARDLATLAQRTLQDFPQYAHYFEAKSFRYKGRTYRTHNRLVQNYKGATGLKTGYTRWSGYNLITTADRHEDKLIGVVLGGRTSRTRDQHMVNILDRAYARIENNPGMLRRALAVRPTPRLKPNSPLAAIYASRAPEPSNSIEDMLVAQAETTPTDGVRADIDRLLATMQSELAGAAYAADVEQGDVDPDIETRHIDPQEPPHWNVQVGAYYNSRAAAALLDRIAAAVGGEIAAAPKTVSPRKRRRGTMYRARFSGYREIEAEQACMEIKRAGFDCFKIKDPTNVGP